MTDPHLHILNNLDDGSRSTEESLQILSELSSLGFTDVICTPHYISDSDYNKNNLTKNTTRKQLQTLADQMGIKIKLHAGNEIYIDADMIRSLLLNRAQAINNQYILFEMPFHNPINGVGGIVAALQQRGYSLIVAHPERYTYFQNNYELANRFRQLGVSFQCNFGSIIGLYGPEARKAMIYFLKHDMVDFLGTDIHHANSEVVKNFKNIERKIKHIIGKKKYVAIMSNNDSLVSA